MNFNFRVAVLWIFKISKDFFAWQGTGRVFDLRLGSWRQSRWRQEVLRRSKARVSVCRGNSQFFFYFLPVQLTCKKVTARRRIILMRKKINHCLTNKPNKTRTNTVLYHDKFILYRWRGWIWTRNISNIAPGHPYESHAQSRCIIYYAKIYRLDNWRFTSYIKEDLLMASASSYCFCIIFTSLKKYSPVRRIIIFHHV